MLSVKCFEFNPFGEHTLLVINRESLDTLVIDPGMLTPEECNRLDQYIEQQGLKVTGIVNTHLHLDHCFGANHVKNKYGVKLSAHAADAFLGAEIPTQARNFGIGAGVEPVEIDVPLHDGDTISVGTDRLEVIHTPGHTPGGICLYSPEGRFLIAGDTLFCGSVGRTDLPGGDLDTLLDGIRTRLFALPDATLVIPGHGPTTTIGRERSNPYLQSL